MRQELKEVLRWNVKEGALPDKLGTFRIHLPYFDLHGGPALAFLRPRWRNRTLHLEKVGKGYYHLPEPIVIVSWKGMRLHTGLGTRYRWVGQAHYWRVPAASIIEVDWVSPEAGTIAVNRNDMEFSKVAQNALRWLNEEVLEICRTFLATSRDSVYSSLNLRLLDKELDEGISPNWIVVKETEKLPDATWQELKLPLISIVPFAYSFRSEIEARWKSKPTAIVRCLGNENDDDPYDGLAWHSVNVAPDRMCARSRSSSSYSAYSFGLSPLWTEPLNRPRVKHAAGLTCQFPPRWNHLCGSQFDGYASRSGKSTIWNPENTVVRAVTADAWRWCSQSFQESLDPVPLRGSLLIDRARVASWILMCLAAEQSDIWDGLRERDESFLPTVWKIILGTDLTSERQSKPPEVIEWVESPTSSRLRILTPQGWNAHRPHERWSTITEYLPDPGPDWTILLSEQREKEVADSV